MYIRKLQNYVFIGCSVSPSKYIDVIVASLNVFYRVFVKLEYLDVIVFRRGVGEVRVVAGRAPACSQVWRGMQYKEEYFYN
jgi:hypothetical protein